MTSELLITTLPDWHPNAQHLTKLLCVSPTIEKPMQYHLVYSSQKLMIQILKRLFKRLFFPRKNLSNKYNHEKHSWTDEITRSDLCNSKLSHILLQNGFRSHSVFSLCTLNSCTLEIQLFGKVLKEAFMLSHPHCLHIL